MHPPAVQASPRPGGSLPGTTPTTSRRTRVLASSECVPRLHVRRMAAVPDFGRELVGNEEIADWDEPGADGPARRVLDTLISQRPKILARPVEPEDEGPPADGMHRAAEPLHKGLRTSLPWTSFRLI